MKTFGYLLVVSSSQDVDYMKLAYALTLSIKNTQPIGYNNVALVVDDESVLQSCNFPEIFDYVTTWNAATFWDGRSWMDQLSPWDCTVCLDVDMLFLQDCSHWVNWLMDNFELFMPSRVRTYRGDLVESDFYRRTFTENALPNLYSMYTFFVKKSETAARFFDLNRAIINNPVEFKNLYLNKYVPAVVGTDEAFALSAKILDISDSVTTDTDFPYLVHLKPAIQGWYSSFKNVDDAVGFYLDDCGQLKIGNFQQRGIVHYNQKNLVTDQHIEILENIYEHRC